MSLREQVRGWLIDRSLGLIDSEVLVARADRAIVELADPPHFLLAVSLGESLEFEPRLDLIKEPPDDEDLRGLASRLLEAFRSGRIDIDRVGVVATRVSFSRDLHVIAAWSEFDWISDELDLVRAGVKEEAGLEERVIDALSRLRERRGE